MAFGKSTTSGDAGELGADRVAKLRQHEALTREIYGCSLDDLLARASERGLREGYAAGYKLGRTVGSRAAKGRKKSSKHIAKAEDVVAITVGKLGCWANLDLFTKAAIDVLSCIAGGKNAKRSGQENAERSGQEIPKEVTAFLKSPRPGNWPASWPARTTLRSAYYEKKRAAAALKRHRELN